jgi:hypothetical protein
MQEVYEQQPPRRRAYVPRRTTRHAGRRPSVMYTTMKSS